MRKILFLLIPLLLAVFSLHAQTLKTDVAVVGQGNAAWSAGLQAAKSGVKTSIVLPGERFHLSTSDRNIISGIAAELKARLLKGNKGDTAALLKTWTDSTANLQIVNADRALKISRSGGNWIIKLSNGKTIKAKVLVNASNISVEGVKPVQQAFQPLDLETKRYRTSIASGDHLPAQQSHASLLNLPALLQQDVDNYVHLDGLQQSMAAGQAAGAIAAYAAFFKIKTSKTNLKAVQGELLNFKQALMPLEDVALTDSNWRAIQVMALMGVFKLELNQGKLNFYPERIASFNDVEEAVSAFYYKANIWFEDHQNAKVDLDQALSLICFVGNKSVPQVKREVEKKWKTAYKFKENLTAGQVLTRRQFAVLLYDQLQLFDVGTDASGRIIK